MTTDVDPPSPIDQTPKCSDTPTQLIDGSALLRPEVPGARGISSDMDLALSEQAVVVAANYDNDGALLSVPTRGGTATFIARIDGTEQGLLVVGESIVFSQMRRVDGDALTTGEVMRVPLNGGDPVVLATGRITDGSIIASNGTLVSDGHDVYYATYDGTKSVPLRGGAVRDVF